MIRSMSLVAFAGAALSGNAIAAQDSAWSAEQTDMTRAIVAEMMADIETRSSLLQSGGTAGHDGRFFLASPDGNFRLEFFGYTQLRYNFNFRDDGVGTVAPGGGTPDDFEGGFQTIAKLNLAGHVFDPSLTYRFRTNVTQNSGGALRLDYAFVKKQFDNGFHMKWGQYKIGFYREDNVGETHQQAIDRTLVNSFFGQGFSQGVELGYTDEVWRIYGSVSDGFGSANTDIGTATDPADVGLTARFDWLWNGDWSQFSDYTSPKGSSNAAMIGAAIHWEVAEDLPGITAVPNFFTWTADLSFEGDGWNVFVAGVGRHNDADTPGTSDQDNYGMVLQGGFYLNEDWELYARYDAIFMDSNAANHDLHNFAFGGNWYIHGHGAKFTAEVLWFNQDTVRDADGFSSFAPDTARGLLGQSDDNEVTVRFQFQLMF